MRVFSLGLLLLVVGAVSVPGFADTTYTYTGNAFTSASSPYATSDEVTGSFTVASPLAPNVSEEFSPTSFSFTDGVNTLTNLYVYDGASGVTYSASYYTDGFFVSTDASGNIDAWVVELYWYSAPLKLSVWTFNDPGNSNFGVQDGGFVGMPSLLTGSNQNDPGVWAVDPPLTSPSAAPEPGSLVLLATGLLGMAGVVRRRFGC